jgi:hypothetical protein
MNSSQSKQWATPLSPPPPPPAFSAAAAFSAAMGVAQTPGAPDAPSPSLSIPELKLYVDEFGNEWTEDTNGGAPAADASAADEAQRSTNLIFKIFIRSSSRNSLSCSEAVVCICFIKMY